MSFNDEEIYNEMESNRKYNYEKNNNSGLAQKIVTSILFLSIGFAVGNIGKVAVNNTKLATEDRQIISTVSSTPSQVPVTGEKLTIKQIAAMNLDSIVEIQISSTATSSFFGSYTTTGSGSGIIISSDGYILTNNHVITSANEVSVRLHDGTEYKAEIVGSDAKTDVGIIKIDAKGLTPVTVGDSSLLSVGDTAVVIGNPLGKLGGTVTNGIISALERELNLEGKTMNLIQTNAAINPGNSGGGLFNSNGELVGIVVAKSSGLDVEGLGFAIPVNDVKSIINDIVNLGYVSGRPYLGVGLTDSKQVEGQSAPSSIWDLFYGGTSSYTRTTYGAFVSAVAKDSSAEKAGIKAGDQIISIDGTMVSSSADVTNAVGEHEIGDTIKVGVVRDNKMFTVDATLEEYKGQTITKEDVEEQNKKEDTEVQNKAE